MALTANPVGNAGGYSYLYVTGCAMRGRYNSKGKTEQKIEIRSGGYANALATVSKDCMIVKIDQNNNY